MRKFLIPWIAICVASFLIGPFLIGPTIARAADEVGRYVSKSSFGDVVFELDNAIVSRGFAIHSAGNQFASMLDRTGAAVGSTQQVYKDATFIEFCSAKHARMMVEADPHLISNCPFIVFAYVLPDRPREVVVGFRRLTLGATAAAQKAVAEAEAMLEAIARDAVK